MAAVTSNEQQSSSSEAIQKQAQEQIAKKVDLAVPASTTHSEHEVPSGAPNISPELLASLTSGSATSSQLAQIIALLSSLDISDDSSHAQSIIDFPMEGSNCTSSGFASRIDSESKKADGELSTLLKGLGEKMLASPPAAIAKFMENGNLSLPKILKEGTALLQNVNKELEQLSEEVKKEESKKDAAEALAEEAKKARKDDIEKRLEKVKEEQEAEKDETSDTTATANSSGEPVETTSAQGFGFTADDSYVFMTNVLATMSANVNSIEAKIAENSAKTADWNYTLNQAFISSASDALNKAKDDLKHYNDMVRKQKRMNAWMKPLMIAVTVISTVLLCMAGQPWLAVMMLTLMTMQLTGGTEKLLGKIAQVLEMAGMTKANAKLTADVIYIAVIVAMACCGNAAGGAMGLGTSGFIMVGTTAMATTSMFDDIATLYIRDHPGCNEDQVRLACMISGLTFCLVANIGAGIAVGSVAGESSWAASLGETGGAILLGGAVADVALAIATAVLQCLMGENKMAMADAEEKVTETEAWVSYFDNLSQQMTQISEQIIDANNASIRSLGEGLSTALNTYAAAGENLAQHMA